MYAAVDIGGSKTLLAIFGKNGSIKEKIRFPTPPTYQEFLEELSRNVANLSTKDFDQVAIAVPGKINRATGTGLAFGNLTWSNVPIGNDAKKIFNAPVILENDARLAALSEALLLKDEFRKVLYVTISTGIGGGLIIDGKIAADFEDMEIGQMLFEYEGKLRDWEDFASGKAFQKKFGHKVSETRDYDNKAWYWFARNIAIGLLHLVATLTPEVIVMGGGAGAHLEKFQDRLQEELKIYANPLLTIPPILKAKNPEEAVIYGCYELIKAQSGKLN